MSRTGHWKLKNDQSRDKSMKKHIRGAGKIHAKSSCASKIESEVQVAHTDEKSASMGERGSGVHRRLV